MYLTVDSTFTKSNFEGSIITPSLIPRVINDPVVNSPSDYLHSVTSQSFTWSMFVNTALISNKIFIDSEGCSNCPVCKNILLDWVNATQSIWGTCMLLVIVVISRVLAFLIAFWINLFDLRAWYVLGAFHVMSTEWHGVRETCIFVFEVTSSHNTSAFEPGPRSTDLSSIAAHWLAFEESTACSCISSW